MRKLLTFTMLAILTFGAGCASLSGEKKQKVVYHINYDEVPHLNAAMGNVKNHINAMGKDNVEIIVVMHGKGVDLLKIANTDLDMQQKIIGLKKEGVAFEVCNNTLVNKKINYKNDLFDVSQKDIVPSGVAEVAILQQKGYVYIKP